MRVHKLKTWAPYFQAIVDGLKTFEIRVNDRGFTVGDQLYLQEWDPSCGAYTGRNHWVRVTYMTDWHQQPKHIVLAIVSAEPAIEIPVPDVA